mgnify:CR=1 FL=1
MNYQEQGVRFKKPVNVLLIFIEGLDRRYLGHAIDLNNPNHLTKWFFYNMQADQENKLNSPPSPSHIQLTPLLDRLGTDSIYFKNFFSNMKRYYFISFAVHNQHRDSDIFKFSYGLISIF